MSSLDASLDEAIPFYHEFSDTKVSQEIRSFFDTVMKRRLVQYFKRQIVIRKQKEKQMIDKYDSLHMVWQKKCDKFENNVRKKQKDAKYREVFEKVFPELRKQREEKERVAQKQRATLLEEQTVCQVDTTDLTAVEEEKKRIFQLAVVPPLCLDSKQRRYKFINNNGFVSDPAALFKTARIETFWNDKEKEIFLEKLLTYGKNFEIISTFLEKKVINFLIIYLKKFIFSSPQTLIAKISYLYLKLNVSVD